MAKLHHMTLKSAVEKFMPMHSTDKKTEAEIKEAIALDEKKYDLDAIEEIYQAIVDFKEEDPEDKNKGNKAPVVQKYIVVKAFRDRDNYNLEHQIGDDVSKFAKDRLDHLVKINHVELQDAE